MLAAINDVQNGKKITASANVSNVMKPPAAACRSLSWGMELTQAMILSNVFMVWTRWELNPSLSVQGRCATITLAALGAYKLTVTPGRIALPPPCLKGRCSTR